MRAKVYKTAIGYDIITSDGVLYSLSPLLKKHGSIGANFKPSGKLLSKVPDHIKQIFFELQNKSQ